MEFCANVCIIIVWEIVHGKTTFATLTTNMIWYYVILPHIFLMNTTHNKDLIVDQGWKTAIQNALSLPVPFNMKRSIQDVQRNPSLQNTNDESTRKVFTISNSKEQVKVKSETLFIETQWLNQGDRLYFGEQILKRMLNPIEVESSYLYYFRELLRLEEMLTIDSDTGEEFEIQELNQRQKLKFDKA